MVSEAIGGGACVLSGRGETIAVGGALAQDELDALRRATAAGGAVAAPLGGRALVLPVIGCERAQVQAWLAGVAGRPTLAQLPRGPLRAGGGPLRRRRRARGRLASRPGSFHLLLSLQDDEALRSYCDSVLAAIVDGDARLRRRAAALAGCLSRAQRALGARRRPGVLSSPHAALPDQARGGADGPLAGQPARPESTRPRNASTATPCSASLSGVDAASR